MAIAQADIINDAYYGVGMFENDKKYQGYSAVGGLYTEACQIVVRADSDIRSVEDLQGKTVSVGEEESGTEKNAEQILAAYGLSERLVTEVNLDYTDAVEQLKKKEIDAMFCTAGAYTTVIGELAKQCEIRFIDLDEKGIDKLMKSYDFYTECEIPENTYVGQTEAVRTVGVKAVLLASDKLSEKKVKEITEILFENKAELQYILPTDISLDESQATEGITIPFHDGAAVYYEEHGISMNEE
jgi:TRAP transporter TAXI family solute receptor